MSQAGPQDDQASLTISIVTACYNSGGFIERLHSSLQQQTYRLFEWVLVDDASTEDTISLLRSLDPPGEMGTRIYRLPVNTGGGLAVGVGVRKAKGEAVVIIDHDDELMPDALARVAEYWPSIRDDPGLCGLFFRVADPASGKLIGGPLPTGMTFHQSWLSNRRPDIADASYAFKSAEAKTYFSPKALERVCLFGVPLTEMSRRARFRVADDAPLRWYHRDNPNSQTNAVRISEKMIYSFARLVDRFDRHYWSTLGRWLRHTLALIRFSVHMHANPFHHFAYMERSGPKFLSLLLTPAGVLLALIRKRPTIVHYADFPMECIDLLPDLRLTPD